jgi:hypothetical protein
MNDEQKPKGSIEHLKRAVPPRTANRDGPPMLDYSRPFSRRHGPGRGPEFAVGFFAYFGTIFVTYLGWQNAFKYNEVALLVPVAALLSLAAFLHVSRGWRGFLPGIFVGLGLSCLIGVGGIVWFVATCKPI